jgi:hypothetical protein
VIYSETEQPGGMVQNQLFSKVWSLGMGSGPGCMGVWVSGCMGVWAHLSAFVLRMVYRFEFRGFRVLIGLLNA